MPWMFRPITWILATILVSVMTHAAAAGSFTRACAARDLQLLMVNRGAGDCRIDSR